VGTAWAAAPSRSRKTALIHSRFVIRPSRRISLILFDGTGLNKRWHCSFDHENASLSPTSCFLLRMFFRLFDQQLCRDLQRQSFRPRRRQRLSDCNESGEPNDPDVQGHLRDCYCADGKPSQLLISSRGRSSRWMLIRVTESSLPKSPSCLMSRSRLDGRSLGIGGASASFGNAS